MKTLSDLRTFLRWAAIFSSEDACLQCTVVSNGGSLMKSLVFATILISTPARAEVDKACSRIDFLNASIDAHAFNFLNAKTTRTLDGRPLDRVIVQEDAEGAIRINRVHTSKQVYTSGHPDQDINGYVNYPNINVTAEVNAFALRVSELRMLLAGNTCGIQFKDLGSAVLIAYPKSSRLKSDLFNFTADDIVISWVRESQGGSSTMVNFDSKSLEPVASQSVDALKSKPSTCQ
jgi:hypothetical protein